MPLQLERNEPHKNATLKLTGFLLCVASNVLERQAPDHFSRIWITGNFFRMDEGSRISKIRSYLFRSLIAIANWSWQIRVNIVGIAIVNTSLLY